MTDTRSETDELVYTRIFDAPRELVFRCMTEPEHLSQFWGPVGTSAPLEDITVDARPGGAFETVIVNDADGSRFQTRAVYVEVLAPERLVWNEVHSGMTVTSTFRDLGDSRTEVRIHQVNVPEALLHNPQARAGFTSSLDRLAGYLKAIGEPATSGG
jgi:uncharacterized protein YndB with AHSA1/START domain